MVRADFFGLAVALKSQLTHRVDDSSLYRLQSVAEERQGAIEHHVHRIVEVGTLGVFAQRNLFEAVEAGSGRGGHRGSAVV